MSINPFTITFGKEPINIISREHDVETIYQSFLDENPDSEIYILTGIRGSGKTVTMTTLKDKILEHNDWIAVELNPETDMLEQLASKLYDNGKLKKLFISPEFSFSFNGLGFSVKGKDVLTNISSFLDQELKYLKHKNIKLLITIDEVVANNNMKIFAHEFQTFLRNKYPVRLLMTGLYRNISLLENNKSSTFLLRAPKIFLSDLNLRLIVNSYINIFGIDEDNAVELAMSVKGYAYAYQLLGNILYKSNKTKLDEETLLEFDALLYERAYNFIFNELSTEERNVLIYALEDSSNKAVMEKGNYKPNYLSNLKRTLVLKGLINESRNEIIYRLPRFKEFLEFKIKTDEI